MVLHRAPCVCLWYTNAFCFRLLYHHSMYVEYKYSLFYCIYKYFFCNFEVLKKVIQKHEFENMAKYTIYTYQFATISLNQYHLFEEISKERDEIMKNKQKVFEKIFKSDFAFKNNNRQYAHKLLFNKDHFIVFRIANDKTIKLEEDFKANKVPHSPSCLVLIDNRNDIQTIAIEENNDAFTDTRTVANILETTFNKLLKPSNLHVEIKKEYDNNEFWDIVDKYPKGLSMVRFEFSYPNLPRVSKSINKLITETSKLTNSNKTTFELKAEQSDVLDVSKKNKYLEDMILASATSGNAITIKAKGINAHLKTGNTEKTIEINDLEAQLKDDVLFNASSKLIEILNALK